VANESGAYTLRSSTGSGLRSTKVWDGLRPVEPWMEQGGRGLEKADGGPNVDIVREMVAMW
jgi:hypothetical protein